MEFTQNKDIQYAGGHPGIITRDVCTQILHLRTCCAIGNAYIDRVLPGAVKDNFPSKIMTLFYIFLNMLQCYAFD